MNRQQRRALKRAEQKKEKTYLLKNDTLTTIKEESTKKAVNTAFTLMLGIPLMVLRDKYGFGKKRLEDFINFAIDLYDSFDKEYVTLEDLHQTIYEETGVKIEMRK